MNNPYRPLINSSQAALYLNRYNEHCLPAFDTCISFGTDTACKKADDTCYDQIEGPIQADTNFDIYDLRAPSHDPFPPKTYVSYLQDATIQSKIGAQSVYQECPIAPYEKFVVTGDCKPLACTDTITVSVNVTIIRQILVLSCLLLIRSYGAVFKYSSGLVTLVILPFSQSCVRNPIRSFLYFRLDLQHRWCSGGHRTTAILPICRIQLKVPGTVYRRRRAIRRVQDR